MLDKKAESWSSFSRYLLSPNKNLIFFGPVYSDTAVIHDTQYFSFIKTVCHSEGGVHHKIRPIRIR